MFTNISWSNYIIAVTVLLMIWYLVMGFKYYYFELLQIISGKQQIKFLNFRKTKKRITYNSTGDDNLKANFFSSFDTLEDAEELSEHIVKAIKESFERNLSKEEFQNYLRLLLAEYPFVKISSLRENINKILVSESAMHPNLLLTYEVADSLWEEIT
ncbi:hypothetical protein [Flavobacterium sp. JAS]|uniref:hypothetical protein n=1 Tax=Flavobacterium sp. JAS TaxID=2897329 RepID=UPI001E4F6D12|nr:hypothetical protein [Flavobacterium sp. JAS]MCD0472497.1 hypothetical protein [Flavobacterium sp. JAS]